MSGVAFHQIWSCGVAIWHAVRVFDRRVQEGREEEGKEGPGGSRNLSKRPLNSIGDALKETETIQRRAVSLVNGELTIRWTEEEVNKMNISKNMQYAKVEEAESSKSMDVVEFVIEDEVPIATYPAIHSDVA
ncbi:hypothetical protein HAX54_024364 [Datura stramonium]|uniref:Uncharacterized protein n=1 Tax=Datura stramonium TaxID=4076 RepID=A0ABS8UZ10_DATST|nr:hypothetical protein [Datura stramonium]